MKRIIKNNYKFIIGILIGILLSVTSVYAIETYIESNKVTYKNNNKNNVQEAIDELYEKSGMHQDKWVDPILNGADPVLKSPLIPVEIKNDGEVYYANQNSEWYNYSEKRWANAVILIDNPSNTNYQVGDHIIEDDIESYFVWIPRYQYKIWDMGSYNNIIDASTLINDNYTNSAAHIYGNARTIDIIFGNADKIPKMTEAQATLNNYYTHPAFTLGNKNLNGIWVGKFETGYKGAKDTVSAQVDVEESASIIIKPDVYSWRGISVKNIFMTAFNYKSNNNKHNENIDPHMMKNTEWGAVAYLSHSEYGIGKEISINNASDYKTGYATASNVAQNTKYGVSDISTNEAITKPYNSGSGYLASTTGNISGIYDMSGGAWEYVAACMKGVPKNSNFTNDELTIQINAGYIDEYPISNSNSFNNRILGDATGEMGPFYAYYDKNEGKKNHNSWYADDVVFIDQDKPWFGRGGTYYDGALGGIFNFECWNGGGIVSNVGFRIALALQ